MTTHPIEIFLSQIPDPRSSRHWHLLTDIILLVMVSVLCGVEFWDEMELFCRTHETLLKRFLRLPYGIPSVDTLNRVMSLVNAKAIREAFADWTSVNHKNKPGDLLSIDGKTLRGSFKKGDRNTATHLVEIYSVFDGIVLGQKEYSNKKNEMEATLSLLGLVDFSQCTITLDAEQDVSSKL